jgi:hypothetical protein
MAYENHGVIVITAKRVVTRSSQKCPMHQLLWTPLMPNFPDFCRIRFFFQHPLQAIQTVLQDTKARY